MIRTYALERLFPVQEIQRPKHQPPLSLLVTLSPLLAQHIPFRLELIAQSAPEPRFQGSQEDSDGVISRGLGNLIVGLVRELDAAAGGELLGVVFGEAVAGGFLGGEGGEGQESRCEEVEDTHCVWMW